MAASYFIPLNHSEYLKLLVNFELYKCVQRNTTDRQPTSSESREATVSSLSWIKSWVDESWIESLRYFVVNEKKETDGETNDRSDVCTKRSDWSSELEFNPNFIYVVLIIVVISFLLPLIVNKLFDILKTENSTTQRPTEGPAKDDLKMTDSQMVSESKDLLFDHKPSKTWPSSSSNTVSLKYINLDQHFQHITGSRRCSNTSSNIDCFLKRTIDCLFNELDKFLINRSSRAGSPSIPLQNVVSASRPSSRASLRSTGRLNSSPSLPTETETDNPKEKLAWQEFQQKVVYDCGVKYIFDNDDFAVNLLGKQLQLYYQQHYVAFEQHAASSLMVTYSLILLEKVLKSLGSTNGLRFLKFSPTGSTQTGLKVTEANQFDAHVIFHCSDFECNRVLDHYLYHDIQPGKIIICAKSSATNHRLLKTQVIEKETVPCLSAQEYMTVAGHILDTGIQKLYTETRPLIDRLPFKIQRAPVPGLVLVLDTRNVIGLGLPEIKVQLLPSFPLPIAGWIHPANVYAVPTWTNLDLKRKPSSQDRHTYTTNANVPYELLWCISYGDLEEVYLKSVDMKFQHAGMTGCYRVCLKILKALFSPICRKSLLSKGEVTAYILQTIVFYLLLESSVKQWSFERLSDRFSDCVIFLQQALRNKRLPNFFVNNPLLAKHMPMVNSIPFVVRGRQENLFSNMNSNAVEKTLKYIDMRLNETGMKECVQVDYSDDMMEYEYFVYM